MKVTRVSSLAACGVVSLMGTFLVSGIPQGALAQGNMSIGTWKLNPAKSTESPGPTPKSLTRRSAPSGEGVKVTFDGIDGNGGRIAFSFTAKYDGNDYPETGVGMPNAADTVVLKPIDLYRTEVTHKRAGKVVATTRQMISKDGKVMTNTTTGTNQNGQPTKSVQVFDKQ